MEDILILVVENFRLIAMDIKNICSNLGYSCRSIRYNSETVKEVEAIESDLILMDIQPDGNLNIIDEAERICDEFKIPIIFFSTDPVDSSGCIRLKNR